MTQPASNVRVRRTKILLRDAQDYLQAVAERVRTAEWGAHKLQLTWSAVIAEDVATTLIQLAEGVTAPLIQLAQAGEEAEDTRKETVLIALATHGRGGLQRWTVGSVAERVLEATRMPLLMVRPSRAADKQEQSELHKSHFHGMIQRR